MVADWMLIYAVLFILGAAVVGRVPAVKTLNSGADPAQI
jgi:hypothetical protein